MAEAREVERHVLSCDECQNAEADFLSLRSQITNFPVWVDPVAGATLSRILRKKKVGSGGPGWRWVFNPAFAMVATLLIVGAVVALLLYPRSKPATIGTDEIASGTKKRGPAAISSPAEGVQKGREANPPVPKASPAPAGSNKTKTPNKKHPPTVLEPAQDNIAVNATEQNDGLSGPSRVRSADAETMTAIHFQKSELLLRSFRNVRLNSGSISTELGYEKKLAQRLVYQNMLLRREADASGDAQVSSLLESLEPILLDIANLSDNPRKDEVRTIKDRVERKNIVALLQVNSTALARALD